MNSQITNRNETTSSSPSVRNLTKLFETNSISSPPSSHRGGVSQKSTTPQRTKQGSVRITSPIFTNSYTINNGLKNEKKTDSFEATAPRSELVTTVPTMRVGNLSSPNIQNTVRSNAGRLLTSSSNGRGKRLFSFHPS